ncbi:MULTISPECIES: thioredoxin family protein [Salipaludibacillus]|nr:thioredoxin family protein [Salipaludibacillus neizhouensis]
MIKKETRNNLLETFEKQQRTFVYFYAPMCGTCLMARKFIEMVEQVEGEDFVYEFDLNFLKTEAYEWEVQSVPCLILFNGNKPEKKLYAFESVTKVFEWVKENNKTRQGEVQ